METEEDIKKTQKLLVKMRRELHQVPELCYQEFETAEIIKKYLNIFKLPFRQIETGIVVDIEGEDNTKTLGFRADMDGLPICEETKVAFKSKNPLTMHACGHDCHMAILLGLAKIFSVSKPKFNLQLVFQPAEEGGYGSKKMIESGAVKADVFYALHVDPTLEVGKFATKSGPIMAGAEVYEIFFEGKNKHIADKDGKEDCVQAVVSFLEKTKKLNSKKLLFHCGILDGGENSNVVAQNMYANISIRHYDSNRLKKAVNKVEKTLQKIKKKQGVNFKIKNSKSYPLTKNTPSIVEGLKAVEGFVPAVAKWTSEDFGLYVSNFSGAFVWLGAKSKPNIALHTRNFEIDERCLANGLQLLKNIIDNPR